VNLEIFHENRDNALALNPIKRAVEVISWR
jgi:hypothetical protein